VHDEFYSGRKALRVISRGKQWFAVYRAHQIAKVDHKTEDMTRRAFLVS